MDGSGKVRVVKRDGSVENFDRAKLASAMWRAMRAAVGTFDDARQLAWAIELYVGRRGWGVVSSAAIFEMALKVLARVRLVRAAEALESHCAWRSYRRRRLRVDHGGGKVTFWDKTWLSELTRRCWHLSRSTARIIAAEVESRLLGGRGCRVGREEVLEMANARVAELGLADAVPVALPALQG